MKRPLVLVIDDEDDIRQLVRELLERAGYEVRETADGRSGLRALYEAPPELVVLDVSMPALDGWATLERIRDLSDVPVLMLTARGLLCALVEHANRVLSRGQLLDLVWGDEGTSRDQVKLYVGYLRRKLTGRGDLIETVRGFGYRYARPGA